MKRRFIATFWRSTLVVLIVLASRSAFAGADAGSGPTFYVDDDAPEGGDGSSWRTAFRHLQQGLLAGVVFPNTAEVRVAAGTYLPDRLPTHPNGNGDRAMSFVLPNGVAVRGGYLGLGATGSENPDHRDPRRHASILSGDIDGNDDGDDPEDMASNSLHVVQTSPISPGTIIDGFLITGGNADIGPPSEASGGGLRATGTQLTVIDCTFERNRATLGGGMYVDTAVASIDSCAFRLNTTLLGAGLYLKGNATVTHCVFDGNEAEMTGGGMLLSHGVQEIVHCVFVDNVATSGGGAFSSSIGDAHFTGCSFNANRATDSGGGLLGSTVTLTGCNFFNNMAVYGGGLQVFATTAEMTACVFAGNEAEGFGGAVHCLGSDGVTASFCLLQNNSAVHGGGGWFNDGSSPVIDGSRFDGNLAFGLTAEGGGLANADGSSPLVTACMFIANEADTGGGISNFLDCAPQITQCVFEDNAARLGGAVSSFIECAPQLDDCAFERNSASQDGGAIWSRRAEINVTDSTFFVNTARNGGAIWFTEADAVLTGCELTGNSAFLWGGAVRGEHAGTLTVDDSVFSANFTSKQSGTAIWFEGDELAALASTFSQNAGSSTIRVHGPHASIDACVFSQNDGAYATPLRIFTETAAITDSTFTNNMGDSGALQFLDTTNATIHGSTFTSNLSSGGIFSSGTIYRGRLAISSCAFNGNNGIVVRTRSHSGGSITNCVFEDNQNGIFHDGTLPLAVRGCSFTGGTSVDIRNETVASIRECTFVESSGTAVWNLDDGVLEVVDSQFEFVPEGVQCFSGAARTDVVNCSFRSCPRGIEAESGALNVSNSLFAFCDEAIVLDDGTWDIATCTLVSNTIGIGTERSLPVSGLFMTNTIVRSSPIAQSQIGGVAVHCNVEGGWRGPGFGNIDADAQFVDPGSDFRLQPTSPCIDAGHNWGVPGDRIDLDADDDTRELFPLDLAGQHRFSADADRPDPGCGVPVVVDMGAYEFQLTPVDRILFADLDGDLDVDIDDLTILLLDWGACDDGCCLSDLDLSGQVDVDDLIALLQGLG